MNFRNFLESAALGALVSDIVSRHPGLRLDAYETREKIELMSIELPRESRGMGVGTEVMRELQGYAQSVGKPIVLRPEAERGRKGDLERFYRNLGFVHNRGRNMDFVLSSPTSRTMYWRPLSEEYMGRHRPAGPDYGAPMHDLTVLYPDDVYENIFQYMSDFSQRAAAQKVLKYRGRPEGMVEVYRAVPEGVDSVNRGDWVSVTEDYARLHSRHPSDPAKDMQVVSAVVKAGELYTDGNSMEEWGYWGPSRRADTLYECIVEARTPKVIMYHGTAFRNLRSIMSHGLIPRPRSRAWREDPNSSFNSASRASLDGIYVTRNLMTALSAATNGANREYMEEGDILVAIEMQPKTAFADEDDLNFMATVADNEMKVADLYSMLGKPKYKEYVENAKEEYRDRVFRRIDSYLDLHPSAMERLGGLVDEVFEAALRRQAAYSWRQLVSYFKDVEAPEKSEAEREFMVARERLTRTMKSLANPFRYKSEPFNLTGRVEEPIGFRGANRIVCVLHVPFDYKQRPRLIYGEVPDDLIRQWEERKGEWRGVE